MSDFNLIVKCGSRVVLARNCRTVPAGADAEALEMLARELLGHARLLRSERARSESA